MMKFNSSISTIYQTSKLSLLGFALFACSQAARADETTTKNSKASENTPAAVEAPIADSVLPGGGSDSNFVPSVNTNNLGNGNVNNSSTTIINNPTYNINVNVDQQLNPPSQDLTRTEGGICMSCVAASIRSDLHNSAVGMFAGEQKLMLPSGPAPEANGKGTVTPTLEK